MIRFSKFSSVNESSAKERGDARLSMAAKAAASRAGSTTRLGDTTKKHRVSVTVSDPMHTMVSKRNTKIEKRVRVSAGDEKSAVELARQHYKKQGFKVHDANYIGVHEETELDEAVSVKKQNYSWGKMVTVHHGKSTSYPLHPEHQAKIKALKDGEKTSFKDETNRTVTAHREGDKVHLSSKNSDTKTTVAHSHFAEEVNEAHPAYVYRAAVGARNAQGRQILKSRDKNHQYNMDAAQREMDRREAEGEDMSGAKIHPRSYEIIKPKKSTKEEAELEEGILSKVAGKLANATGVTPQDVANSTISALNKKAPGTKMHGHPNFSKFKSEVHAHISSAKNAEEAMRRSSDSHVMSLAKKHFTEGTELDELNQMTLSRYAAKARAQSMDKKNPKRYKRGSGAAQAYDKLNRGDYSEELEQVDEISAKLARNYLNKVYDTKGYTGHSEKRNKGLERATKKVVNQAWIDDYKKSSSMGRSTEQVEIGEISSDLLKRYKDKATQQASAMNRAIPDVAASSAAPEHKKAAIDALVKKGNKRFSGVVRATNKQFAKATSEEKEKDEPPFDPDKSAKAPVTDKSGAVHTAKSRVRHLARFSAMKQAKSK